MKTVLNSLLNYPAMPVAFARSLIYLSALSVTLVSQLSFAQLATVPVPTENPITESKRVLGKILFWDEQLSSDNSVACGTCHAPTAAGAEPRVGVHPGADGVFGNADDVMGSPGVVRRDEFGVAIEDEVFGFDTQVTGRYAPNFFGALWSDSQFWDGRAEGQFVDPLDETTVAIDSGGALEIQSLGPIMSSVEMAKDGRTWAEVTEKLESVTPLAFASDVPSDMANALSVSSSYPDLFADAFGSREITPVRIAFALATYERTLVADQTPFDLGTLTGPQQAGLNALGATSPGGSSCLTCHSGANFTDNSFRNIGVRPPEEDLGRQDVTGLAADRGRFKVPSLRNLGVKTRFMHNGSLTTLAQVIAFYAPGNQNSLDNIDPAMPIGMPPPQVANVIDFLENGLTDPRVVAGTFPFDAPTIAAAGLSEPVIDNVPIPPFFVFSLAAVMLLVVRTAKHKTLN